MKKRNTSRSTRSNKRRADRKRIPLGTILITFLCGSIIFAGIFIAASQHFSSMSLGMQNSKLRKELDDFQAENRRLTLAKEIAMSPGQIRKLAHEIGMNDVDIANEPIIKIKETKTETAAVRENTKETEPKIELASMVEKTNVKAEKPKVVKTVEAKASNRKETVKPVEKNSESAKVKDGGSRPRVITVAKLR
jgi:hypothetical protein